MEEDRICECGHFESSHVAGGCQKKSNTSCHAAFCDCEKFVLCVKDVKVSNSEVNKNGGKQ